jgi:hypothetical protein
MEALSPLQMLLVEIDAKKSVGKGTGQFEMGILVPIPRNNCGPDRGSNWRKGYLMKRTGGWTMEVDTELAVFFPGDRSTPAGTCHQQ